MAHSHHHHDHSQGSGNLKLAFFLNLGFTIVELIGGIYVNSVAILSDAIHDLGDSLSLGLAWGLDIKSKQKANDNFSFGYGRFSLLGALINGLVLIIGSIFIVKEAIERLYNPEPSNATGMILFALVGVAVNGYAAWKVSHGSSQNEKVISWHLMEDVLGWVAVLIAGILLYFFDIPWIDPVLSLAISTFILWNVVRNLKETIYIFLQAVPSNISLDKIKSDILSQPNVESLHHVHIWSLEGANHVFTAHIKLKEINDLQELSETKSQVQKILKGYPLGHFTIEWELPNEECALEELEHDHSDHSENTHSH